MNYGNVKVIYIKINIFRVFSSITISQEKKCRKKKPNLPNLRPLYKGGSRNDSQIYLSLSEIISKAFFLLLLLLLLLFFFFFSAFDK